MTDMELPQRMPGDELLKPGEMLDLRRRLRNVAAAHDLTTVIACAFDPRTRMLPFLYADKVMAPAGVRAIGAAMVDAGFPKTRIVLGQWNRRFRPSEMRLDGRVPDLFMVSSMVLHSAHCDKLIDDVCRMDPQRRPLVIVGGPRVIYEPWTVFPAAQTTATGADVAVTGEEYVLLSLLEVLLSIRAPNESMRSAFQRARDVGALDDVPGLVYARTDARGIAEQLVDTGIQRLLRDLDELPHPVLGYQLLESPSRATTLAPVAIPADRVRTHTPIASLVLTQGCRFSCPYCSIPAYNQRQFRAKSGERIADEIGRIGSEYAIRVVFGADDNFFADQQRTIEIVEALARRVDARSRPHCKVRWGTEATIHDTLKMRDHLALLRKTGLSALWLGVEDMSGGLVNKGQSSDRTTEAFSLLRHHGIFPIPMLMHHDEQPLWTWRDNRGLLNQLRLLRKSGAVYMQVLALTPAPGSRSYEETYAAGSVIKSANGVPVTSELTSGLHVIASGHRRPWSRQLNLLLAYGYFFNPLRLMAALIRPKTRIPLADVEQWPPPASVENRARRNKFRRRIKRKLRAHFADAAIQLFGMYGLAPTLRRTLGWTYHLMRGRIDRQIVVPACHIPIRAVDGGPASHALKRVWHASAPPASACGSQVEGSGNGLP
jgi:radical SAM superfamily enzyme YgiQ (UPF0313 family)